MSRTEALDAFYGALLDDDAEQLYERAPCGYLSTTPDGLFVKVNQTFLTLTGYTRDELIGRHSFADLLSPGGRIYHETHVAPMLRMHGNAREIALDIVRADGGRLPVLVNAVLEREPDGSPRVIRAAVFDATDRREYERELLRAKLRAEESEARATALARTLQQTLIPPSPPTIPGLLIGAAYRPAGDGTEVGGDFFDVFQVDSDTWVVVIGDVRGKGVDAAVVTALARYTLRGAGVQTESPSRALDVLNDVVLQSDVDRFCTVAYTHLKRAADAWTISLACAGHPLPLLLRRGGAPEPVGRPGTLIGVLPSLDTTDVEIRLTAGDTLLLYTDGVTEARAHGALYGEDRLVASLAAAAGRAAQDMVDRLLDDVMRYQGGHPRDDIALVAVTVAAGR